jgi:hypothetical protein
LYLHGELGKWTYTGKNVSSNISAAAQNLKLATPEYEKQALALTDNGEEVVDMVRLEQSSDPVTFFLGNPQLGVKIFARNLSVFYREDLAMVLPLWLLPLAPVLLLTAADTLKEGYRTEFRDAGKWINDNAGGDKLIMDREYSAAYYSGGTAVIFPYADYRRTTAYARSKGVDYMVVGRQALSYYRPELAGAMTGEKSHPDWLLVHRERPDTDKEVLVFQLLPSSAYNIRAT